MPDVIHTGENQFSHQQQNDAAKSLKSYNSIVHSEQKILSATNATKSINNEKIDSPENNSRTKLETIPSSSLILPQSKEDNTSYDLIYLRGPCTEAAIINMMKMRFLKNLLQVKF